MGAVKRQNHRFESVVIAAVVTGLVARFVIAGLFFSPSAEAAQLMGSMRHQPAQIKISGRDHERHKHHPKTRSEL
jgi:hypothetical protein